MHKQTTRVAVIFSLTALCFVFVLAQPGFLAAATSPLAQAAAAENQVPPFYPPKLDIPDYTSPVRGKGELSVALPCGFAYKLDDFCETVSLDGQWKISGLTNSTVPFPDDEDLAKGYHLPGYDDRTWDTITVPLDWYRKYPSARTESAPFVKGWYRKKINIPAHQQGKSVILHFDVIGYEALLFVNGQLVGSHRGDFTPWEVEITDFVRFGEENLIALRVFSDFGNRMGTNLPATHAYGSQWSISNIKGGLWQSVRLSYQPPVRFQRILVTPLLAQQAIRVDWVMVNGTSEEQSAELYATVISAMKGQEDEIIASKRIGKVCLEPGINRGHFELPLENPRLWTLDDPQLYYVSLAFADKRQIRTARAERFGYRDFKILGNAFYLNGTRVYLFGENLSSVGYGGVGVDPETEKQNIANKLVNFKRQGYNIFRNPHMPIVPAALEVADEIGMMVYNEWAWAFTDWLDPEKFEENNLRELEEWVLRDYNHPSVVMWSLGNEVKHSKNQLVCEQLDKQARLVRQLDLSGRPICTFSGVAGLGSYGYEKLETDFLDLHTYLGLSSPAWTNWEAHFNATLSSNVQVYGTDGKLSMPFVIWECVGYSWGGSYDSAFTPNDIEKYAVYAAKPTTWANPNGIGFAGTIGLAAALDSKRGLQFGREHYGKRTMEFIRYQHDAIAGFAPWFHDSDTPAAALWNQPLFVGLRRDNGLILTNLFTDTRYRQNLYLVNSQERSFGSLSVNIFLVGTDGSERNLTTVNLSKLAAWEKWEYPVELAIPADLQAGNYQLRIQVYSGGKEVSRNFYDLFIQAKSVRKAPIQTSKRVGVWRTATEGDAKLQEILTGLNVSYTMVDSIQQLQAIDVLIMPPADSPVAYFENPDNSFKLLNWIYQGGRYLQLEQNYQGITPLGQELFLAENTFVDLAIPAHPIFSGLSQSNFDTWQNPQRGYSIKFALKPFTKNALAVRGPFLGETGVYNAVAEGIYGSGLILTSQLLAATLWAEDSAACTYLRGLFSYILQDGHSPYTRPWILPATEFKVEKKRMVQINLAPYANRGFSDEVAGDGLGGWIDSGRDDMRVIPVGEREFAGVPFRIINPASNNDKSCLVLRGKDNAPFPDKIQGISVNQTFSRLFFLHALAWPQPGVVGEYRINYEDGTSVVVPLISGQNIGNWKIDSALPQAFLAFEAENLLGNRVGLWLFCWENPKPERKISTIDFVSNQQAVLILVAISGETTHPAPLIIDNMETGKKWNALCDTPGTGAPPVVQRLSRQAEPENVCHGDFSLKVTMPPKTEGGTPVTFVKFDLEPIVQGEEYHYLTFWIKAENSGTLNIVLPKYDWGGRLQTNLLVRAGEWRKVWLNLKKDLGLDTVGWPLDQLRGEFFIYYQNTTSGMTFYLDDIRLE